MLGFMRHGLVAIAVLVTLTLTPSVASASTGGTICVGLGQWYIVCIHD